MVQHNTESKSREWLMLKGYGMYHCVFAGVSLGLRSHRQVRHRLQAIAAITSVNAASI